MSKIRIQTATQTWESDQPRTFVIGREETCDVVVAEPGVSRRHAEIRAAGDGWEIVDLGSSHGTFVNGRRVSQAPLSGTSGVRVGAATSGLDLTVTVTSAAPAAPVPPPSPATAMADRPAAAAPPAPVAPGLDMTMLPGAGHPGGFPGYPGGSSAPGLLVRLRSGDKQFPAGQPVRIGRDPGLEVVAENPSVSRHHATVEPRPDGWWLVDRSTAGTYVDGERITAMRLEEPTEVCLGHPTAGYELEVVPVVDAGVASAGIAKKKRNKVLALTGAALALLLVVGGGVAAAVVLGGDDDSGGGGGGTQQAAEGGEGLSEAELTRAKAATVYLVAVGPDGVPTHSGSGSIISDDGLILSNAHVADSDAPGQGGSALDYVEVYFTSPDDDAPVELRYLAEPIVSDGYLDITVAQITADAEGNEVDPADLDLPEPLPLGDSDELKTLDEITALGYPSLTRVATETDEQPTLTVTKGTVAAFNSSEVIGDPRSEIDADLRIGSGNSGGPSIDEDGEIVGLNTRVVTEGTVGDTGAGGSFTGGSARVVPINLAEAVLDIAEAGGDPSYVSPYLEELPDPETEMNTATIEQHGWAPDGSQGTCTGTSTVEEPQIVSVAPGDLVHAEFTVTGLANETLFDIVLFTIDGETELERLPVTWDAANDGQCVYITFEVPQGVPGINAVPQVGEQYVVDNPLQFQ